MRNLISSVIILLFLLISGGCKKTFVLSEKQQVLFQYDFINYANGYIHEGFYIDDDGNVLSYKNPAGWNFHSADYNISEVMIAGNLNKCTLSGVKVEKEELAKLSSHINNIASSKVTAKKNLSNEAGTAIFVCYSFDEQNGLYKGSLIKMEGDYTCENLNFYSKKVNLWLRSVNDKVSGK